MIRSRTTRRIGMAAAALLLGGTIGFTGPAANAGISRGTFTPYTPSGSIVIAWSANGTPGVVAHYDAANNLITSVPITLGNKCEITNLAAVADILSITTTAPNVATTGVNSYENGLGVNTGSSNCTPGNGRIVRGQTMTFALGSRFATGGGYAGQQMIGGAFDIEAKYNAGLRYTTDGGTTTRDVSLAKSSDNGSDSTSADNNRVTVSSTSTSRGYTSIRVEAIGNRSQAAIAVDNGGDWIDKAANKTVFMLGIPGTSYEYTVNCGDVVDADGLDNQSDGAGADSVVGGISFFRLANKNQTSCAPIGVTVQATNGLSAGNDDDVLIDNSTSSADGVTQNVRARVRIIWIVETSGKTPDAVEAELAREIDYTPADAAGLHPVQWCTNVPATVAANPLTATDTIGHPVNEPWCLLSDTRIISGTKITQTQIYSANGDPRIS